MLFMGIDQSLRRIKIKRPADFSADSLTFDQECVERFTYTQIDDVQLIEAAKKISPVYCEEISLENALTKNITLFEMLNILSVEDINLKSNWDQAEIYKTMAAPLGVKTKNEIVYLDLHEKAHGPHGLVAGTTGSGKSEILQTYIPNTKIKILQRLLSQAIDEFKKVNKIMAVEFSDRLKRVVDEYNNRRRDEAFANEVLDDVADQLAKLLEELKAEKDSFKSISLQCNSIA